MNEYMTGSFGSDATSKNYVPGHSVFGALSNVFFECSYSRWSSGLSGGAGQQRVGSILRSRHSSWVSLPDVKINPATNHPFKQRQADLVWTVQDDAILRSLIEKYSPNWVLIADAFNSCRVTVSTEKRLPLDCFLRWNRWRDASAQEEPPATPQAPTTQMTTRGIKRSFSTAMSASVNLTPTTPQVTDPKKRRHSVMQEALRKAARKRDAAQKAQCKKLSTNFSSEIQLNAFVQQHSGSRNKCTILMLSTARCPSTHLPNLAV